ncbi:hypothetical protein KIN20_022268 [Parelaphostrongylus tenuis]|uniref:Uncharacterized protein n=1 Tax=Parelaphostrongylus tenuis TaxID=148309 RepID=A0AAD5N8T7_PARTN|nr:hypothetical protein KIN20_022268 [Parelaphostrongylus tenuis]
MPDDASVFVKLSKATKEIEGSVLWGKELKRNYNEDTLAASSFIQAIESLPRDKSQLKSDLSGIFYRSHSFYPYFVTLWEHYHMAQFTVAATN